MKRTLQIIGGIIGVIVLIFLSTEIWVQTESILFLISLTCTFPFAVVYIITGRFVNRRYPLIAVVILVLVGGVGLLVAWGNPGPPEGFSAIEVGFITNLSTEIIGAAITVLLLSGSRNLGNFLLLGLALVVVVSIEQTTGTTQDVTLNLGTELLGTLLTALVIYRFVERFDEKSKRPEA